METAQDRQTTFNDMEIACIVRILSFLEPRDCARAACVHSLWRSAAGDDSVWKGHLARDFLSSDKSNADGTPATSYGSVSMVAVGRNFPGLHIPAVLGLTHHPTASANDHSNARSSLQMERASSLNRCKALAGSVTASEKYTAFRDRASAAVHQDSTCKPGAGSEHI
eukprot:GHUV01047803.1.p1 GENE.GHUV01047803.1~~GHUV01047803.1.p1  ORF type:complete len:167 (-),score=18.28 GHUV01047803.1:451-951(-)